MPSPVRLTDAELDILFALAGPIAVDMRQGFLAVVAEALAESGERGPGAAHRAARTAQGPFICDLRRAAESEGTPRYSQKPFASSGLRTPPR
jgi:hypothetical protein